MNEALRENLIGAIYLSIVLLGVLSYFLHKRKIRKFEEKLEEYNELTITVNSFEIPKPLDEKLVNILVVCYVVFTIITLLLSNRDSFIGTVFLLFCAVALAGAAEKFGHKKGYNEGYDKGYTDSYHKTLHNTTLATTKQILSSLDETTQGKTLTCKIINSLEPFKTMNKNEIKSLLKIKNIRYSEFIKYLKNDQYFYMQNEE